MNSFVLLWIGVAVVFTIVETLTVGLFCLWFVIGAIVACLAALLSLVFLWQVAIFLVVSILCLLAFKPLLSHKIHPSFTPTNADRLIGLTATVTEEITPEKTGAVQVDGQIWSAKSDTSLPVQSHVRITAIEGVKLIVIPL